YDYLWITTIYPLSLHDALPISNISVKNLFYNIPARRNFLKSNSVEMRHIIDEFQRLALAHPEVFFSLHSDNNELFHLPAAGLKQDRESTRLNSSHVKISYAVFC